MGSRPAFSYSTEEANTRANFPSDIIRTIHPAGRAPDLAFDVVVVMVSADLLSLQELDVDCVSSVDSKSSLVDVPASTVTFFDPLLQM